MVDNHDSHNKNDSNEDNYITDFGFYWFSFLVF